MTLVAGPAAVDGQHPAGGEGRVRVGQQQGPPAELTGFRPAADRNLSVKEVPYLRVAVDAFVQRRAERPRGQRVDGDPGSRDFGGEAPGELDDRALAGRVA